MKLYLKQKVFSWRDRFFVNDEYGNERYYVEGEIFTWGKKLHVYNTNGVEAAFIRQKVMSWRPRFFVEIGGRVVCEIVKDFTFFRQSYSIDGLPWQMEGDFWAHEYSLHNNGQPVMYLSKKWFTWGDSYELNIANPQDELLCLSIALAVDCVLAQEAGAASASSS